MQAVFYGRFVSYKLQPTSHKLQAACCLFPTPRTRQDTPAEIRGPCRTKRPDSVAAALPTASYAPRAVPSPSPRTTNNALRGERGGHTGPLLRRGKPQATNHEPQTTSYMPPFLHSSQAGQGTRELEPRLRRPPSLVSVIRISSGDARPQTQLPNGTRLGFRRGGDKVRGDGGNVNNVFQPHS